MQAAPADPKPKPHMAQRMRTTPTKSNGRSTLHNRMQSAAVGKAGISMPDVERRLTPRASVLEEPLQALEQRLFDLGVALHRQDIAAVDRVAAELHLALAAAVDHFAYAAQQGGVPSALRHRLALASGQVAAQREALARATASLDRAIDVLIPSMAAPSVYGAAGLAMRRSGGEGGLLA